MPIHDVDVDPVGTRGLKGLDGLSEAPEIG